MLICMQSTSVRVSGDTHRALKALAEDMGLTVGDTVDLAVRRLIQNRMGQDLAMPLDDEETQWLEADLS
jgi:antitoxin component of RelBE/YafQ-DinJ toxin-antitoxin module